MRTPPRRDPLGRLRRSPAPQPGERPSRGVLIMRGGHLPHATQSTASESARRMPRGTPPKWCTPLPKARRSVPGLGRGAGRRSERRSEVSPACRSRLCRRPPRPARVDFRGVGASLDAHLRHAPRTAAEGSARLRGASSRGSPQVDVSLRLRGQRTRYCLVRTRQGPCREERSKGAPTGGGSESVLPPSRLTAQVVGDLRKSLGFHSAQVDSLPDPGRRSISEGEVRARPLLGNAELNRQSEEGPPPPRWRLRGIDVLPPELTAQQVGDLR